MGIIYNVHKKKIINDKLSVPFNVFFVFFDSKIYTVYKSGKSWLNRGVKPFYIGLMDIGIHTFLNLG